MADLTHRRILRIAVPVVLANITIPLLGLVDTGVIGQMGLAAPIGAVGIGTRRETPNNIGIIPVTFTKTAVVEPETLVLMNGIANITIGF